MRSTDQRTPGTKYALNWINYPNTHVSRDTWIDRSAELAHVGAAMKEETFTLPTRKRLTQSSGWVKYCYEGIIYIQKRIRTERVPVAPEIQRHGIWFPANLHTYIEVSFTYMCLLPFDMNIKHINLLPSRPLCMHVCLDTLRLLSLSLLRALVPRTRAGCCS